MIIIGAKGFAKQLFDIVFQNNPNEEIFFFDDVTENCPEFLYERYKILKKNVAASDVLKIDPRFALGLSSPKARESMSSRFLKLGGDLTSIISSTCSIGAFNVEIGNGSTILHSVIIESNVKIGQGVLINHGAIITHDVEIGNYCEICPGAIITGNVTIGDYCFLGTNSTILPKINVGNNVIVGAGSVVTRDIPDNTTVLGIPAKRI